MKGKTTRRRLLKATAATAVAGGAVAGMTSVSASEGTPFAEFEFVNIGDESGSFSFGFIPVSEPDPPQCPPGQIDNPIQIHPTSDIGEEDLEMGDGDDGHDEVVGTLAPGERFEAKIFCANSAEVYWWDDPIYYDGYIPV